MQSLQSSIDLLIVWKAFFLSFYPLIAFFVWDIGSRCFRDDDNNDDDFDGGKMIPSYQRVKS
tara:strand:- start:1028 stop:1213 length:186 start_codon:yes stop_codon:yes gene_type:complete